MKRDIIKINEELCNGCGQCVPNCHEGALRVIDGKVRLVNELMCDGLGACIGHCPEGAIEVETREAAPYDENQPSELRQWPVQMHLINPSASYFSGADLLLSADCVAYSTSSFHNKYLRGKSLIIACPKLDHGTESYVQKLTSLIDKAKINTINVMMMEVPCCSGLLHLVKAAQGNASRNVPVKSTIISIRGDVLREEWL